MAQPAILVLEEVSKSFSRHAPPAVAAVNLTLRQGDLLSFLGPSGCGKTTLLRLIAGFERPQTGTISIAGKIVAGKRHWLPPEKRDVGMVFQDYALFPHLTVAKNIAFGLHQDARLTASETKRKVAQALELVGLSGLGERFPHQISGGQQQRVALARALAPAPDLVLLDEPLSNLDVQVRLRLRQELRDILKAAGASAIFVTHDQEEALSIADAVAVMRGGKLEQYGTPEEIYQHPKSRFVAEFVTQANFLPARRNGEVWETEIGAFSLPPEALIGKGNLEKGDLMIRQEDLIVKLDEKSKIIIRDRQFLGREHRYLLQTPSGRELTARSLKPGVLPIGKSVRLAVAKRGVRLFL